MLKEDMKVAGVRAEDTEGRTVWKETHVCTCLLPH